ncbi:HIT family protein [Candidatus Uhrbacteria bacterium]|nr:HIT family protein [Candidatus Uhrbacteria bacterium]
METCIFCEIIKGGIPSHRVFETDSVLAFLDIHPTNPGHTIVVPKVHHAAYSEAPDEVLADLARTVKQIAPAITQAVSASAWNLIVNNGRDSGQIIFHTHWHIVPRFADDGFRHWKGKAEYEEQLPQVAEKIRTALG